MKILIISHEATLTGAPKVVFSLSKALEKRGHSIKWIFDKGGPLLSKMDAQNYQLWKPDLSNAPLYKRIIFNLSGATKGHNRKVNKWVRKKDFDLIINNTAMNGEILQNLLLNNIPVVSIIHEMETVLLWAESMNQSVSKTLKKSNYLIAVSEPVKMNLIRLFNANKNNITIIPGYADISPQPKSTSKNEFIVGGCGSLIQRKGIDQFLAVAKLINDQHSTLNIRFMWVGGIQNTLAHFEFLSDLKKLNLEKRVSIVTQTTEPEKYFSRFDVLFMSSREDPFPLVNMEVAQFGVPIICYENSGGSVDFAQNGGGIVLPFLDTEKVANSIIELYNNHDLLESLCTNANEVGKKYSKEALEPVWIDFLEKVIL